MSLLVDPDGITFRNGVKMFYGSCDETEQARNHYLARPQMRGPGIEFNFEEEFHYTDFR